MPDAQSCSVCNLETPGVRLELDHAQVRQLPVARLGVGAHVPPPTLVAKWWEQPEHREVITELQRLVRAVDKRRAAEGQATA